MVAPTSGGSTTVFDDNGSFLLATIGHSSGRTRTSGRVAASNGGSGGATERIASAKTLLDSGAINASEYEQLKSTALGTRAAAL